MPKENRQRIWKNLLPLAAVGLLIVLGCGNVKVPSGVAWTSGCVTPDKSRLGIGGGEAVLVDLKNGEIKKRLENYPAAAACLPNGEVLAVNDSKAVWLSGEKQVEGRFVAGVIGVLDNERLVGATRVSEQKNAVEHFLEPLQVIVSNLNSPNQKKIGLDSPRFPGVEGYEFRTIPIRLLADGRLLTAAGEKPESGPLAHPKSPWGFFTVDLEKESIEPFGAIKTSDDDVNLADSATPLTATADGKFIAGVFGARGGGSPKTLVVFTAGKEAARSKVEAAESVSALGLNDNGSLLAVGIVEKDGAGRVEVTDLRAGKLLWSAKIASPARLLEFLGDESLILMTEKRGLSRRAARSGDVKWEIAEQD